MRELAGRLSALDPEASDTLRVIEYFDKLVDGRVGAEGMLRGAAVLGGATVGYRPSGVGPGRRFDGEGSLIEPGLPEDWPAAGVGGDGVVWLERRGEPHANDAMILERLALSLSLLSRRLDQTAPHRRAVEVLVAGDATPEAQEQAMAQLGFPAHATVRAIAMRPTATVDGGFAQAIVATRIGVVRAVLAPDGATPAGSAGIGVAARGPAHVQESWRSALVALRLSGDREPVVHADDLGALLTLAEEEDHRPAVHADVRAIDAALAAGWAEPVLRGVAAGTSVRALAVEAGVHHSTMEARRQKLPLLLGYDPSLPRGRTRLDVALMLHRLAYARFDVS